ncbi:Nucleotide-diphospho-sugar transferase family protein [Striga hermonthica]|uniref:Glycosyltransferase n=1 Tax=Striga hermonthica TaxID=68872 RepID=A0A9N7NZF5_STRHE|nr:Nucleotide-diphospho-sugar transferase family protein [Striga hermonthica]
MAGPWREKSTGQPSSSVFRSPVAATAIGIGVAAGFVIFILFNRGWWWFSVNPLTGNRPLSNLTLKADSSSLESTEALKSKNVKLSSEITELKTRIRDLSEKLCLAERESSSTPSNYKPQKPGPFGTVKGPRTSPPIIPDETVNPRLAQILSKVAIDRELILALASSNVKPALELWFTSIKKAGIFNYLVAALDTETLDFCISNDVPVYRPSPTLELINSSSSHEVSGLKFRVLREFLQMGYSVLLSDIDIVFLQNPFGHHLYRDCDVEAMSDGHDNLTAYGYDDVFDEPEMGWSRYAHTMRIWVYNSGFFYIRPTLPSIELLDRVASRLDQEEEAWDQAVFNEEMFYPSSPGYNGLHVSRRTMDLYLFMNSKVLFKVVRKDYGLRKIMPVVVHLNYHLDKVPRMKAVIDFYVNGKGDALDPFSEGSAWNPNEE